MAITAEKLRIPINNIEVYSYLEDSRFKKVKIWVAHTGVNINHTSFSVETFEKMIPTLSGVPIVGFIEKNKLDEDDFSDHRQRIVFKDGDIEQEYLGHSYGFIPEDPNAKIEYREGKEWLTAEGYLWTKFKKAVDIISESNGSKSHSMEIDSINGFVDDDGVVNVTDARFTGLCILGDEVAPAMSGSTVEFFSGNSFKEEIKQMLFEFSKKGVGENLDKDKLEKEVEAVEEVEKVETTEETKELEVATEPEQELEPEATEDEYTEAETPEKTDEGELEDEPESEVEEGAERDLESAEDFELTYSISFEDVRAKLHLALDAQEGSSGAWLYILETFDDHFVYVQENSEEAKYFKVNYKVDNESVVLGDKIEVLPMFVTADEQGLIKANRDRIEQLTEELQDLQEYKLNVERDAKMLVLDKHASQLDEKSFSELKESIDTLSELDLEKEIAFSIFKRQSQEDQLGSRADTEMISTYSFKQTNGRYGDLDRLFVK